MRVLEAGDFWPLGKVPTTLTSYCSSEWGSLRNRRCATLCRAQDATNAPAAWQLVQAGGHQGAQWGMSGKAAQRQCGAAHLGGGLQPSEQNVGCGARDRHRCTTIQGRGSERVLHPSGQASSETKCTCRRHAMPVSGKGLSRQAHIHADSRHQATSHHRRLLTEVNVTPGGGSAVAVPVVGPVSCALVSVGAPSGGVRISTALVAGRRWPSATGTAVTRYGVLGDSPSTGQLMVGHFFTTHDPPLTGHRETS